MAYAENVFINCPFDADFEPLRNAMLFAIADCGFIARCALESSNGHDYRFEKIKQIIDECRFGIHDISRTELDNANLLPRFNNRGGVVLPGGAYIAARYEQFKKDLLPMCMQANLQVGELTFSNFARFISTWAEARPLHIGPR